jgi:hypothetical protein
MSAPRPINYDAMTCAQLDAAIQHVTDQIQPGHVGRRPWPRPGDISVETGMETGQRTLRDRYLDLVECRSRKGCP